MSPYLFLRFTVEVALLLPMLFSSVVSGEKRVTIDKGLIIDTVVDLNGDTLCLQPGSKLSIMSTGKIINGAIEGDNSGLVITGEGKLGVKLIGSWRVPFFTDDVFDSNTLTDNEIIASINNLMSDDENNRVILNRDYRISITEESGYGLDIKSNTEIELNGRIRLTPNNLRHYYIIRIKGRSNVKVSGGEIIGDVGSHEYVTGSTSEWGMGFYIYGSHNISISKSKVSLCTGDGFYVGGAVEKDLDVFTHASSNIIFDDVVSDNNRRQGMSITHAQDVNILNSKFINTGQVERTAPASGMDIEPNRHQSVRNITITNCLFENNYSYAFVSGGTYRVKPGKADTYNLLIKDCTLNGTTYICNGATIIEGCEVFYLKLRDTDMPKGIIRVSNTTINEGVYIGYTKLKERIDSDPQIQFSNCHIQKSRKDSPYANSLLAVDVRDNVRTIVTFSNCSLSISNSLSCSLFSGSSKLNCTFSNCRISMPNKELVSCGACYIKCVLDCLFIGVKSKPSMCDVFEGCKIDTSDKNKVFLIYDNIGQSSLPDFEILNCYVYNTLVPPFSLNSRIKSSLTCRVVGNSFKSDYLSVLEEKFTKVLVY